MLTPLAHVYAEFVCFLCTSDSEIFLKDSESGDEQSLFDLNSEGESDGITEGRLYFEIVSDDKSRDMKIETIITRLPLKMKIVALRTTILKLIQCQTTTDQKLTCQTMITKNMIQLSRTSISCSCLP